MAYTSLLLSEPSAYQHLGLLSTSPLQVQAAGTDALTTTALHSLAARCTRRARALPFVGLQTGLLSLVRQLRFCLLGEPSIP